MRRFSSCCLAGGACRGTLRGCCALTRTAFLLSVLMVVLVALISLHLLLRRVGAVRANPLRPSMVLHRRSSLC